MNKKIIVAFVLVVVTLLGLYLYKQKAPIVTENNDNQISMAKSPVYQWTFTETEADVNGIPHTIVNLIVNENPRVVGTYPGSCHEVPAGEKGVMSELADPGEVSRVQCWFAGGGNEIGVFEEGNNRVIKVGELGEGNAETTGFRGNFKEVFNLNQ